MVLVTLSACAQSYLDVRKPLRIVYGGDTVIISHDVNGNLSFTGSITDLALRDSTLLEIIEAHGGSADLNGVDTITYSGTRVIKTYQDEFGNYVIEIDGYKIYYSINAGSQTNLEADYIFVDSIRIDGVWFNKDNIGGGGAGTITGTISTGQLAFGAGDDEIIGSDDLIYRNDTLSANNISKFYVADGIAGEVIIMEDGYIQFTTENSHFQMYGDAVAGDSVKIIGPFGIILNGIVRTREELIAYDSVRLAYIPTSNATRWLGFSHTKGVYADSTDNAGEMLTWKERPNLRESMDTLNGEWLWYTFDKNGIHAWRGIADIPSLGLQIQALMGGVEYNRLELYDRDQRIEKLEKKVEELLNIKTGMRPVDKTYLAIIGFLGLLCLVIAIKK